MEFGVFLLLQSPQARPADEVLARGVELAQAAEELGFRNVWLGEHHFSNYSYLSRPVSVASYLAARTSTIRLGFAVLPLPLHHPVVVAEEIAMLDVLSGGRVDAGFGRGYWQYVFDRLGADRDRERFDEALDVVLLALRGETFSYDGAHFQIPPTRIVPQPLQRDLPVWIAAQSPESVRDTIRRGLNVLSGGTVPIDVLARMRADYDELVAEFRPPAFVVSTQRPVYVADSAADARAAAEHVRWNVRVSVSQRFDFGGVDTEGRAEPVPLPEEPSLDEMLRDHMVCGTPDECIAQLRRFDEALRPDHFNASFWFGDLDQARVLRSLERFAREVMPAFAD